MKRTTQKFLALALATVAAASFLVIPAFAKEKSGKNDKKSPVSVSSAASISLDRAKEIALAHAGVDSGAVVFTKAKLDKNRYEIEFRDASAEYEYEISASSGSILECDIEKRHTSNTSSAKPTPNPTKTPSSPGSTVSVSLEQAKEIALAHAGVDSEAVVFTEAKLDKDKYELEFKENASVKYEYEISALDGSVLEYKAEIKRSASASNPGKNPASVTVSLAGAKEIAIAHAGVVSDDVTFTEEKLDKGVYELEFNDPTAKYEYEVSAADGFILEYKVEVYTAASPKHTPEPDPAGAISSEEAQRIALEDAELSVEDVRYVTCYVSWKNGAPYAYVVKFATRAAGQQYYTIGLYDGTILANSSRRDG